MTEMAAAQIMLDDGIGILRTLPSPEPEAVERFRLQARILGAPWPEPMPYGEFLRTLDPTRPQRLRCSGELGTRPSMAHRRSSPNKPR